MAPSRSPLVTDPKNPYTSTKIDKRNIKGAKPQKKRKGDRDGSQRKV